MLPELLLSGGPVIVDKLVELFALAIVWRDGCVVSNWCNALIVPVPKEGDFKLCDNLRGSAYWMWWGRYWAESLWI